MIRVAIVESEDIARRAMAIALRDQGFEVHETADAMSCNALLKRQRVEAIVVGNGLPGLDGPTFATQLRARIDVGILIITQLSTPEDRIEALDLGADDYLVKPVHLGELGARIRSVVRRCFPLRLRRRRVGEWTIDLDARAATSGAGPANLTRGEFDILARLIEANSKIVSREDLQGVISREPSDSDLRSVDTLVSRLRRKLGDQSETSSLIVTAPGFGYRLRSATQDL